uniref:ML domain-containing protein n=1 Tax=Steinernema glaseri TaxID=37863 RepID=A0A1I7YXA5_9BILA
MRPATALLCLLLPISVLCTCPDSTFPNGTATHFHHFSCGAPDAQVRVVDIRPDGENFAYPLEASLPISLLMPVNNSGSKIKKLKVDVGVYLWNNVEENSGNCFWEEQETYGMTDDLEGCEMMECPLATGETAEGRLTIDIAYAASFIESGKLYQLVFKFKNADRPEDVDPMDFEPPVVGCTVFQTVLNGE